MRNFTTIPYRKNPDMDKEHVKLYYADITKADTEKLFSEIFLLMENKRKERVEKCKNGTEKKRLIVTGALLLDVINDLDIKDAAIEYDEFGKPYFLNRDDCFFNISHSGDYVVIAVSGQNVGCDIQEKKEIKENVLKRITSEKEREYIFSKGFELTFVWALKESYSKYIGKGLSKDFREISFKEESKDSFVIYDTGRENAFGIRKELLQGYEVFVTAKDRFVIDNCQCVCV